MKFYFFGESQMRMSINLGANSRQLTVLFDDKPHPSTTFRALSGEGSALLVVCLLFDGSTARTSAPPPAAWRYSPQSVAPWPDVRRARSTQLAIGGRQVVTGIRRGVIERWRGNATSQDKQVGVFPWGSS